MELYGVKHIVRNNQLVVLMKILCSSFFVCSNCYSDMRSLNVNHVTDYNLGFYYYFNFLFIVFFGAISILKNVEKRISNLLIIDAG